jgi:hypothetical protein
MECNNGRVNSPPRTKGSFLANEQSLMSDRKARSLEVLSTCRIIGNSEGSEEKKDDGTDQADMAKPSREIFSQDQQVSPNGSIPLTVPRVRSSVVLKAAHEKSPVRRQLGLGQSYFMNPSGNHGGELLLLCGTCMPPPSDEKITPASVSGQSLESQQPRKRRRPATTTTKLTFHHVWEQAHHVRTIEALVAPLSGVESVLCTTTHDSSSNEKTTCLYITCSGKEDDETDGTSEQHREWLRILRLSGYSSAVSDIRRSQPADNHTEESQPPKSLVVRSVFFVEGICCASEVPSIRRIINNSGDRAASCAACPTESLRAIHSIQINITMKRYVVK